MRECAEREAQAAQIQEDIGKAESIGRLLRGESVAQIVGNARGEGWMDFANCLGDMLVLVATNAGVDRAAFVKKLGYKKAKQTLDKIEHGTDYPLGHKKAAA